MPVTHSSHLLLIRHYCSLGKKRRNQGTGEKTEALNNKVTNRGPQSLYEVCIWMALMVIQLPQILQPLSVAMCSLYLSGKRNKDEQNPFTFPPMWQSLSWVTVQSRHRTRERKYTLLSVCAGNRNVAACGVDACIVSPPLVTLLLLQP